MKAKKILKWIILIILFLLVSFHFIKIVTYIMKPNNVDLINIAGFYGEKKNSLDMIYIGGSSCFVYWEPLRAFEQKGIASYNYAGDSIPPELYKTMIKEVLKTQNPNLIIVDARAFQWRNKTNVTEAGYRNALTGMPLSLNKIDFIKSNVNKYLGQNELSYYFDVIKYHRDTKNISLTSQIKMAFNLYQNENKGFYFIPKVYEAPVVEKYETKKKTPVASESELILIDLLEYMKTTNCNYLFVVSPYIEQEEHKENFNYISEIIGKYGYNFLDCNDYYEEMKIDFNVDFYNGAHVNIFGAEKYTDFLIEYIQKNYNLPDRREEYKDWQELLPNWNTNVEAIKREINKLIDARK